MEDREGALGRAFEPLEALLVPVGCTGVEDKLSDGVEDALQSLVKAGVQVAVLTGDKTETAMSICTSCGLFIPDTLHHVITEAEAGKVESALQSSLAPKPPVAALARELGQQQGLEQDLEDPRSASPPGERGAGGEALIISGECLRLCYESDKLRPLLVRVMKRCYTTVCTRMTPKQKAEVTRLVRDEFGVVCLSIGDGANDVSMIREADVGVGVFGKEGAQAVNSADFAVHKFADLTTLLFVHGTGSKLRIIEAARASLFANVAFNTPQVIMGFFSAFSATTFDLSNALTFCNLTMTAPFIFALALLDRELLPQELLANPQFYRPSALRFSLHVFSGEMVLAFSYAAVTALVVLQGLGGGGSVWRSDGLVAGYSAEMTLFTMVSIGAVLVNLALRFHLWTALHALAALGGVFWLVLASLLLPMVWGPDTTDNGYILEYVGAGCPSFYLVLLLGVVASALPFVALQAWSSLLHPTPQQVFREIKFLASATQGSAGPRQGDSPAPPYRPS
jgi:phospholipid-translocating ATPase